MVTSQLHFLSPLLSLILSLRLLLSLSLLLLQLFLVLPSSPQLLLLWLWQSPLPWSRLLLQFLQPLSQLLQSGSQSQGGDAEIVIAAFPACPVSRWSPVTRPWPGVSSPNAAIGPSTLLTIPGSPGTISSAGSPGTLSCRLRAIRPELSCLPPLTSLVPRFCILSTNKASFHSSLPRPFP